MKKSLLLVIVAGLLSCYTAMAQEKKEEEKKFGISFSGYVKNDFFLDTRQTVAVREGHFLLWPVREVLDENGVDINEGYNLNMLAVQSRLSGKITGPDAFGAKTSGLIEADFFAQADDNINLLRLRHAYLKLNWTNTELLAGQYWNPLFVTGCFPGVVSFNTGTPIQSFARNPQIRLTQKFGNFSVIAAILSQRDYASRGLLGPSSSYLRNSAIPDLHFQIHYAASNDETGISYLLAVGVAYKSIVPRLSSTVTISPETTEVVLNLEDTTAVIVTTPAVKETYAVDEKVSGLSFVLCQTLKMKSFTFKLQYRYGENLADVLAPSGFAVLDVVDPATGELSYTPLRSQTVWGEIHTNGKSLQVGVFGGIVLNMGTKETMSSASNAVYGLATDIETLYRVAPRVVWNSEKVRFALELEYTSASYGNDYDENYKPASTTTVANLRTLLAAYYFF